MYSIRLRLNIATTQIHGQNSRSAGENFLDVMQGITHSNFPCFRKQGKGGTLKLCDKVEDGTDKSLQSIFQLSATGLRSP